MVQPKKLRPLASFLRDYHTSIKKCYKKPKALHFFIYLNVGIYDSQFIGVKNNEPNDYFTGL